MRADDPLIRAFQKMVGVFERSPTDQPATKSESVRRRGSLADLIDSDVYTVPYIGPVVGDAEAEIRRVEGVVRLVIDPRAVDYDARVAAQVDMDDALAVYNGFPLTSTSAIADAVKGEQGKQRIKRITQFYKGKVPSRFGKLLIEGMALRIAEDNTAMEHWEVRNRKQEIAKSHERRGHSRPEAYAVASLCSAGYFDPERLLQRIYREQVEEGPWTDGDYANAFEELVTNKPFVVFVTAEDDESPSDVYHEMLGKSLHADEYMYPVQYIDIRGKGERPGELVKRAADFTREHHPRVDIREEDENGQTVARVFHDTLAPDDS